MRIWTRRVELSFCVPEARRRARTADAAAKRSEGDAHTGHRRLASLPRIALDPRAWTGVGSDRESEMNINFPGPYYF